MRIITADETGLVKVVRLESGECLAVSQGHQTRQRAVRAMCHVSPHSPFVPSQKSAESYCTTVAVARTQGTVETWDMSQIDRAGANGTGSTLAVRETVQEGPKDPVAVACFPAASADASGQARILTCNAEGDVQVTRLPTAERSANAAPPIRFSIRGPVSAAIVVKDAGSEALAAGGKENDLKLWDVNTAQCSWKAKNVPHDSLDMRQPVWISALRSLVPATGEASSSGARQQIVAGTAHRQVRLYDIRAQKRPTHSVDTNEHGVTTMTVAPAGTEIVVADTAGLVRVLDLRKMKWGRRFEGPAGSVRGVAFHPTLPVLACVGLDRMARVYDYRTREQKSQIYLKQRLNAVLFDDEGEVRVASGSADAKNNPKENAGKRDGSYSSDSEEWGSGEEYEMGEGDSSEHENGEPVHVGRPVKGGEQDDFESSSEEPESGVFDQEDSSTAGSDGEMMSEGSDFDSNGDGDDSDGERAGGSIRKRQASRRGGYSSRRRRKR